VSGVVNGGTSGVSATVPTVTGGMTVTVVGTNIIATTDGAGRFALTGVPAGDIQLHFSAAGIGATLVIAGVGEQEQIQIDVTVSGANATLNAQHRTTPDQHVELQGLASSVSGTCPNLTFMVNGAAVVTNGSTRFEDGPCSAVQNLKRVEVKGTRQANGSVLANEVEVKGHEQEVELEGVVSGLGGACPNLTFMVNGAAVVTNGSTRFEDGPCSAVQNRKSVEVEGTRQANGSVLAKTVEIED